MEIGFFCNLTNYDNLQKVVSLQNAKIEYLFSFYSFQSFHQQINSIVDNFGEINTFLSFLSLQLRRKSSTFAQIWTIESGNNKILHSTIYLCTSTSPFI